jgi:hypothetical protein
LRAKFARNGRATNFSREAVYMNKSVLVSALLVAGLVVACGDSGTGGSGGSGGGSGGESAGGTSSDGGTLNVGGFGNGGDPGNGGSTTNNMSTTTGMTGGCDDTGVCQDQDQDPTNDCISCAFAGECADELNACGVEPDCCTPQPDGSCGADSFVGCIGACQDQACFDACAQDHQTGALLYNELTICAICDQCPIDCDGPGSGCP